MRMPGGGGVVGGLDDRVFCQSATLRLTKVCFQKCMAPEKSSPGGCGFREGRSEG